VARSLGAEFVVDYSGDAWAKGVAAAAGNGGVQVVFDGVGGSIGREAFELLAPGGRLCTFGIASGSFAAISEEELAERHVTRLRGAVADPAEMASLSARALAAAAAGELHPVIGQEVRLAEAAEAHRAIEARATLGKTLLVIEPRSQLAPA
jgi:NADPH2:quinone reductase